MEISGKKVRENISLAPFTTFKVGGEARYFFTAKTKRDLTSAIKAAKKENLPFFILGGGSNLLVSDNGYKGLAIKLEMLDAKKRDSEIYAEAGAKLDSVVKFALKNSLEGLEWAAGIPGTIGGAVYGNIGAFGSFIKDNIKKVEVLDGNDLKLKNFSREECKFSLKSSVFKDTSRKLVILSAVLNLKKGNKKEIEEKTKQYLNYRKRNHPLNYPSAGCIFKNIEHKISDEELLNEFPQLRDFDENSCIPTGFLIEKSGLKGKKIGKAQISEKHANFIVNLGGAKAKDIANLIELIKHEVKDKFGIDLETELQYIGF